MTHPMTTRPSAQPDHDEFHDDIIYPQVVPFVLVHLAALTAFFTGVTKGALILCVVLYVARMFGVTAGYHRYFSHRTFKTSRVGQFVLAFLAQSSAQRGILWWAAMHRHHHRHSDTEQDIHSPRQRGFLFAHVGWVFHPQNAETDLTAVPDLTKYPELVWLDKHPYFPATVLGVACFALGGWTALVVGFVWSTVLLYHGTFFINSLAHVHGSQRYVTGDDSRNNWWLAVITLGEGWHNNHHAYQRSTRQGFRWYEFDPTFYALTALSWVRVVSELGAPPADVVSNERRLGRAVIEKVARQLAAEIIAELPHLHIPTREEIHAFAERMLAATPSMDEIVERAREHLAELVSLHLSAMQPAPGAA
jgi:stearoyl-CoA desaturase (delta-9 desaturase)